MQKLKYEKFRNSNEIIIIDLHNDYSIIAISTWDNERSLYITTLLLKENTIDTWNLIEKAEKLEFKANKNTINSAVLKYVANLFEEGFFVYYIQRYKYESDCCDKGIEIFEKERLGIRDV